MLITKQTSREALERLGEERSSLTTQVTTMLAELEQIRCEAKKLVADRRQLDVYVTALRTELEALQVKRGELLQEIRQLEARRNEMARTPVGVPAPTLQPATVVMPDAGAADLALTPAPATDGSEQTQEQLQDALKVVAAHRQVDLEIDADPDEDQAFKAFFDSEVHPDKSREWILS